MYLLLAECAVRTLSYDRLSSCGTFHSECLLSTHWDLLLILEWTIRVLTYVFDGVKQFSWSAVFYLLTASHVRNTKKKPVLLIYLHMFLFWNTLYLRNVQISSHCLVAFYSSLGIFWSKLLAIQWIVSTHPFTVYSIHQRRSTLVLTGTSIPLYLRSARANCRIGINNHIINM